MATERLIIEVTEKGSLAVRRNIDNIGKRSKTAASNVNVLRTAIVAVGGAAAVRGVLRAADAFTNIQNRLRLVTEGTTQLNTVQNELLQISNRTRSSIQTNADLFNRLALSTRDLGLTQRDVLQLTESLNQAVLISGATSQEASAGLIQLSQGLASGALRGDELRSVLEQLPAVADVIAKELGVTRGELRELGADGAITADVVTRAFANAREELSERFGRTVPTISQGFTVLRENVTFFVGRLAEAIGLSGGLGQILLDLGTAIGDLSDGFTEGALAVREFVEVATVGIINFAQRAIPTLQSFGQEFVKVFAAITGDEDLFIAAFQRQDELEANIEQIRSQLDAEFDAIARNAQERRDGLGVDQTTLDFEIPGGQELSNTLDEIDTKTQNLIERNQELFTSLVQQERALEEAIDTGGDYSEILERLELEAFAAATGQRGLASDIQMARDSLKALRDEQARGDFLQTLREENEALQIAVSEGRDLNEVLEELAIRRQFINDQEGLQEALDLQDANVELRQQLEDSESAVNDFARRARENIQDTLGNALANAFSGGLDDLPQKFAQILADLVGQLLASQLLERLSGLGGGGGGGGEGGPGFLGGILPGLFGAQNGADFRVGGSGGVDSQLVAFKATPGERVMVQTPEQERSGGALTQQAPQVNVQPQIVNVTDPSEIPSAMQSAEGEQVILNVIRRNPEVLRAL